MNRSAPWARIVPVIRVGDVRAAVDWYSSVLGLVEHVRIGQSHRAQLGVPGVQAELVVAESREDSGKIEVMIKVEDVDAVLAAALAAGANEAVGPHDWEYGERQASFVDPFGQVWMLTQTLRDTDPTEWGGETVSPRTQ
jgi:PhnB protein